MTIRRVGAPNGHPESRLGRDEGSRGAERASTRAGAPNGHPESRLGRDEGSRGAERASMRVRARVEARG